VGSEIVPCSLVVRTLGHDVTAIESAGVDFDFTGSASVAVLHTHPEPGRRLERCGVEPVDEGAGESHVVLTAGSYE